MKEQDLVVLKDNKKLVLDTDILHPHINYRCITMDKEVLVYGIIFSKAKFNKLFEFSHARIIKDFKELGLLTEQGKPISKSLFTKLADIHIYGRGTQALKVWYFRNTRERIYGFYPNRGTKIENAIECYEWYLDIVNGNMESVDQHNVMFGNCGVPLAYEGLRIS